MAIPLPTVVSVPARSRVRRALRLGAYVVAALALLQFVRSVDLAGVGALLRAVGPFAPLALLPFALQMILESGSWRLLLGRLGHPVGWRTSLRVTLGADAIRMSLPGGTAIADGLRPVLFRRHGGSR